MNKRIFLIDPQSVNSLATYDKCMIENIKNFEFFFFGNADFNEKPLNHNVRFYPVFTYTQHRNKILKGISYIFSLSLIFLHGLQIRPAIIHLQWIRIWKADWLMLKFFKKILGSKIIFTVHNILPRKRNKNCETHFKKLYNFADLLVAHTETTKRNLEKTFDIVPEKIIVMPHGVINMKVSEKDLLDSKEKFEKEYHFENKIIFGALGVQGYYKGTDLLIDAWENTEELKRNKNIILLIAGKNACSRHCAELSDNVIVLSELLSNPDFLYLMRRTDVMVLPYREIDQSGVLLSLINEHKPYCSTNVGELQRPFEIAEVGWKIPDISSISIAGILKQIVKEPASITIRKQNNKGWEKINDEYSWRKSNIILAEAYESLTAEKQ